MRLFVCMAITYCEVLIILKFAFDQIELKRSPYSIFSNEKLPNFHHQDYAACEKWIGIALTLLDKVKEDQTRVRMKSRLDNMSVKTFYLQAKYEKAAQMFDQCFGSSSGIFFTSLIKKGPLRKFQTLVSKILGGKSIFADEKTLLARTRNLFQSKF